MATSTLPNTLNEYITPSVISTSPCRIVAIGNLRIIYFTGIVWRDLVNMTIPEGSRPLVGMVIAGTAWASGSNFNARHVRFRLGTDGKISEGLIFPYFNSGTNSGASITSTSDIVIHANCISYGV